ncbi:flagellar biosynthetic protein FliO [Aureimonas pseudogalii]|uniref:Flagellar biosynthesis protein FliO n=1 Tax=Aureimonas pseudogalii TaxID=1744844 RepID=A0A7W6MKQ3_9HYPH|nr:flagellar biosynthetic protein FliO [Aureimonas pseudogalii]MBB3999163.1 hypothetical protein [Aureimonas pseudogalii]
MREWLAGVVGENLAPVVSVILAAAVVILLALVLIGLAKRVFSGTGGIGSRSRAPRLAVLDVTAIDPKRKLVLVRRDEVEHLLLIGGQNDLVVEPTILRGQVARRPRVDGAAPRREPEVARDAPADRVAAPVPPRRVPAVSSSDTLAPVVDLPLAETVLPVSISPRETTASRQRAAARVEPLVDAPSAPRGDEGTRSGEPDSLFPTPTLPGRGDDVSLPSKPTREIPQPPGGAAMRSPETDPTPPSDIGRRAPADARPAWMMANPEPQDRSPPKQDGVNPSTRAAEPVEDLRSRGDAGGAPAPVIFASPVLPTSPARPTVSSPAVTAQTRPEPSASIASPVLPPAPTATAQTSPTAPRSMATPTLPVPVRAPTLPLPPLQRPEPAPPAPPASPRSLWSPATATTPGNVRAATPETMPLERAPTSAGSSDPIPVTTSFIEAPRADAAPASEARAEPARAVPAPSRSGPAPFPAAPGTSNSAPAGASAVPAPVASTPSSEPDSRQPLSVRSFATTIQERRTTVPTVTEPRPVPTTPIAPPVPAAPAASAVASARANDVDTPRVDPVATPKSAEATDSSSERDAEAAETRPLTLEEEMERLLHDFTIDVSDRR